MNKSKLFIFAVLLSLLLMIPLGAAAITESGRVRRSSADQRIAELQALLALAGSRSRSRNVVAHGLFDPDVIGKKKRVPQYASIFDEDRYSVLKALIKKADENALS